MTTPRFIFLLGIGLLHATPALGSELVIDDFSAGPLEETLTDTNRGLSTQQTGLPAASTIGGRRFVGAVITGPAGPSDTIDVTIDTTTQQFALDVNAGLEAFSLRYGLQSLGVGEASEALNLDLSDFDAFEFFVVESSAAREIEVQVRSGVDEGSSTSASFDLQISAGTASTAFAIPFSAFVFSPFDDPPDFSDIDYISLGESLVFSDFDLVLGGLTVVPEPASGVVLLVGSSLALRRRRLNTDCARSGRPATLGPWR